MSIYGIEKNDSAEGIASNALHGKSVPTDTIGMTKNVEVLDIKDNPGSASGSKGNSGDVCGGNSDVEHGK